MEYLSPIDDESEGEAHPGAQDEPAVPRASPGAHVELEPGWVAATGLARVDNDDLIALMLRPSFRPAREFDLVPVSRCTHCLDGGLRTAGTVRTRHGRRLVSACDTCGMVVLGTWSRDAPDTLRHGA